MKNIDRGRIKRKTKYISYRDSQSFLGAAGVGVSTGVGDMVEAEIGSLSMVALVATAGDEHDFFFNLPRDVNVERPIGLKIRYSTASATGTDTHTWIALYDVIAEDAAVAIGTTALDTAVAVDTDNGVANAWQWSPRGVIDGATFTKDNLTGADLIAVNIEFDATDASETVHLHGIQIDYVPKRGLGPFPTFNPALTDE